jgi:hypothetical protein
MEMISWTNHVRNVQVLLRVKDQRNILHEIRKWKANWIGHILSRNCLLQLVIEGKIKGGIEVAGRWGRRHRKLLDDKERRGYSHLKEDALDRTMCRARFGRGFGLHEWISQLLRGLCNIAQTNFVVASLFFKLVCCVCTIRVGSY